MENSKRVPFTFEEMKKTISRPVVFYFLLTKFFYSFGFTTFESTFALFALRKLNLPLSQTSFVLAYVGILIAFTQGFLVGKITKKYREDDIIKSLIFVVIPFLILYSFSQNLITLILLLTPLSIMSGLIGVSINSIATKTVEKDRLGGTLGLFNSVDSLTRIISPLFGSLIIQYIGPKYLGLFIGTSLLISSFIFFFLFAPNYETYQKSENYAV